mmetsp:Transcript_44935/g.118713  ORF Transcript_44935/g.118713 Transcript_44935/m.118713 type:complete len:269 (-) Transcript_44935:42-848(-)
MSSSTCSGCSPSSTLRTKDRRSALRPPITCKCRRLSTSTTLGEVAFSHWPTVSSAASSTAKTSKKSGRCPMAEVRALSAQVESPRNTTFAIPVSVTYTAHRTRCSKNSLLSCCVFSSVNPSMIKVGGFDLFPISRCSCCSLCSAWMVQPSTLDTTMEASAPLASFPLPGSTASKTEEIWPKKSMAGKYPNSWQNPWRNRYSSLPCASSSAPTLIITKFVLFLLSSCPNDSTFRASVIRALFPSPSGPIRRRMREGYWFSQDMTFLTSF